MEDYKELFDEIISLAWRNFIRKFRRGEIMASEKSLSEVMFQFCFANEIQSTGREYIGSDKVLEVNLETKWSNPKADTVQPKLIDITCHIIDDGEEKYACAIELKFKRKRDAKGTFGKDRMARGLDDYGDEEISELAEQEPEKEEKLTFEQVLDTLSIKERNRYLELETRCAVIGKFIHPDGEYSDARKAFMDKKLSPKQVKENGKDTLIYSYYPNVDEQEIDALFFSLQSEHRKAQSELNGIKNEINRHIDEDWRHKNDIWSIEHEKWANSMVALKERIMREKEVRSKEIENLKIVIPDSLRPIYDKIRTL